MSKEMKKLEISFSFSSEAEKQQWKEWLDDLFGRTSFRRVLTKESCRQKRATIFFEDTGARSANPPHRVVNE
jgi:hypothetical protein